MTTLQEIFDTLASGELAHTGAGDFDTEEFVSEIDPRRYHQLITHINLGLKDLYTKFWLSTGEVILDLVDEKEFYKLSPRFAVTNTESPEAKYIMDSLDNPFTGNVAKIEEIYDESGCKQPLNDLSAEYSYYTSAYNVLQVPLPNDNNQIAVMYRATHPKIVYSGDMNPEEVEVDIPPQLFSALCLYVGHRYYAALDFDQGQKESAYFQKYQVQCAEVERAGLFVQPEHNNWRFKEYGWV
jgi:hypothetical protein